MSVVWDVSMSLDGYTAGPNISAEVPMGEGGEELHEWMSADVAERESVDASVGAAIVGRYTYDLGLRFWGGTPWAGKPAFVVTHRVQPDYVGENGGTFSFSTLDSAVQRAKEVAGSKDVFVLGAAVARQLIRAGLLDEIRLHLVPKLLGGGTPMFDGEKAELIPYGEPVFGAVTHLRFRVGSS